MIKKSYSIVLCVLFIALTLQAQSPYKLNWKKEVPILGVGAAVWGTSFGLSRSITPLTDVEIAGLDRLDVNGFDRWAIDRYSIGSQDASDIFFYSSYAFPALFLIPKTTRNDFGTIALLYAETILITSGLTYLAKVTTKRPRPLMYNQNVGLEFKQSMTDRLSFFSGHSSETAANCFFAAKIYNDYFPDSQWRPLVWGAAAVIPAITAFLRVTGGKHFPTDIITGYAVGAATGILVPHFHKKRAGKNGGTGLSLYPTPAGAYLSYTF